MIPNHYLFDTFHGKRIHLGITGSIAAYKALELTRAFLQLHLQTSVTLTASAQEFIRPLSFTAVGAYPVYSGMFAPGTDFDHLEPSSADALLVAPATANIIAKAAHGIADDLLSCQILAFPGPILIAPAMNPRMWSSSATQQNVATLLSRGVRFIMPAEGKVACGDTGTGKLAAVEDIFLHTLRAITPQDLAGKKVMLTLGPTREYFDRARFWSNPSTGIMGACLAISAALRGAEVTAICGPISLKLPDFIKTISVTSAREMFTAAQDTFPGQDIGCFTAAVADFRPPQCQLGKFKKSGEPLTLTFDANPDILATLSIRKASHQITIGFAAEAQDLHDNATSKLVRKNLDLIVANPITSAHAGFGSSTNQVFLFDKHGREESWPILPKTEVAWRVWDWISQNFV